MSGEVFDEDIVGNGADCVWRRTVFNCCGVYPWELPMSGIRSVLHRRLRDSASANTRMGMKSACVHNVLAGEDLSFAD